MSLRSAVLLGGAALAVAMSASRHARTNRCWICLHHRPCSLKVKLEVEQWITGREGQAFGHFHHIDMATEVEYGLEDNLQVSAYVNYMYADEAANSVRRLTEGIGDSLLPRPCAAIPGSALRRHFVRGGVPRQ